MYVCMHVCMYVCMYIYIYIYISIGSCGVRSWPRGIRAGSVIIMIVINLVLLIIYE